MSTSVASETLPCTTGGRAPLLLFLLALAARSIAAMISQCISSDGPLYIEVAHRYAAGDWVGGFAHVYHPLYPMLVAAAHGVLGDWESAGEAVSVLASALGTLPLYHLARRVWDGRVAATAGFLYAISPYPVRLSAEVLTTGLYLGLSLLALWACVEAWTRQRSSWFALAGAVAGLSYLCRVDGMILAGVLAVGTALRAPGEWRESGARRVAHLAAFVIALAALAGPYVLYLRADTGGWHLSRKTSSAEFTANLTSATPAAWAGSAGGEAQDPPGPPVETPRNGAGPTDPPDPPAPTDPAPKPGERMLPRSVERRGDPGSAIGKWLAAGGRVFVEAAEAAPWALVLFGWFGVGLAFARRPRDCRELALLAVPVVFLAVLLLYSATHFRESKRYTTPIGVWWLPWCAAGLVWTSERLARRANGWGGAGRILIVLVAVFAVASAGKTFKPNGGDKRGERLAGEWIREHARAPAPVVLTSVHRSAFYARAHWAWLESDVFQTPESLRQRMQDTKTEFLVVDRHIERNCPGFFVWVADPARSGLRLVFSSAKTIEGGTAKDDVRVYAPE